MHLNWLVAEADEFFYEYLAYPHLKYSSSSIVCRLTPVIANQGVGRLLV